MIHSASKYISGHSDIVAGVVVGSKDHIGRLRDLTLPLFGGKLAPFEAWLLIRGLRTLPRACAQHQATADLFADRFAGAALRAPRELARRQHRAGPDRPVRADLVRVRREREHPRLADALRLFRLGVSWGGFESLILPAQVGLAQAGELNSMRTFGVSPHARQAQPRARRRRGPLGRHVGGPDSKQNLNNNNRERQP